MGQHTFNFEAMQSYQNKIVGLIKEQITKLDNERSSLEAKKSQLEKRNADISKQISSLSAQLSSSDEDNNNASILSQISALESEMTANESTISSISSRLSAISSLKSELDTGIKETNNYLNNIAEAIQEADGNASKAAKAIQNQLSAYNTKIKDIINSVNRYRETYTDSTVGITFDGKDFGVELETTLEKFNIEIDSLDKYTLIDLLLSFPKIFLDGLIQKDLELLIVSLVRSIGNGLKFVNGDMVYIFDLSEFGFDTIVTSNTLKYLKEFSGITGDILNFFGEHANVISAVIDIVFMISNGERADDVLIKAVAHLGLGMLADSAGGFIGAAIGSLIPVPVVGTLAGMVLGVALGSVASELFDQFYDRFLQETVNNVTDWVDNKINDFGNWVQGGVTDFGNWVQGKPASAGGAVGIARVFV